MLNYVLEHVQKKALRRNYGGTAKELRSRVCSEFNKAINATQAYDLIPAVKLQVAMYMSSSAFREWQRSEEDRFYCLEGLISNLKRGDIGSTSEAYAVTATSATCRWGSKSCTFEITRFCDCQSVSWI